MKSCKDCKWSESDDTDRLYPICNSNYDMFEPKSNNITADKIKQVADILKKQKLNTGFDIRILENTLMEDGQAVLVLNSTDYKRYIENIQSK